MGFMAVHPFHDETVERIGHPTATLPGPQVRGTGGTLNLIMFGIRPGPPAGEL